MRLSAEEKERLQHPYSGGLILFAYNYESLGQLRALTAEARAVCPEILISTDHEGGEVQRFLRDFTRLPAAAELGEMFARDPESARSLAGICGKLAGVELRRAGVNVNYAPVLDVTVRLGGVIGGKRGRSFAADADIVALLATAYAAGLAAAGVAAIGKHFPGHGKVRADSHLELPQDARELSEVMADLSAFERCLDSLHGMLTAHVVYPMADYRAATFSPVWLQEKLRRDMDYDKAILCDDLTMGAVGRLYPDRMEQAVEDALDAGNDFLLVCNDADAICRALNHLEHINAPRSPRNIQIPERTIFPEDAGGEEVTLWQNELTQLL